MQPRHVIHAYDLAQLEANRVLGLVDGEHAGQAETAQHHEYQ